jgi:hypothetical protein
MATYLILMIFWEIQYLNLVMHFLKKYLEICLFFSVSLFLETLASQYVMLALLECLMVLSHFSLLILEGFVIVVEDLIFCTEVLISLYL